MAPIEIPAGLVFNSKVFDIGHVQQLSPSGDVGFIQTINRSSPTWYAEYSTPPLSNDRYDDARVFFDQLEGSMNTFLAYDPRRPMPRAYQSQSVANAVWGTPRIIGQSFENSTINLDQLTTGSIISKGDYISVLRSDIWYLWRAQETRTIGGTTATNLLVKPRPNVIGLANTAIRYRKACMEMKMIGRVSEEDSVGGLPSFSFKAVQFTRRAPI